MKPQSPVKRLAKALVVLLTFGSFLGITSTPATAVEQDWTIEVDYADSSPQACVASPSPATWEPDVLPIYPTGNGRDKANGPGLSFDFVVSLRFEPGTDTNSCADSPDFYQPSGIVLAEFVTMDPQLTSFALDCAETCTAESVALGTDEIGGTLMIDDEAAGGMDVTYSAQLRVVWTP